MTPAGQHPLISGLDPQQALVYRPEGPVSVGQFVAEAQHLAERLSDSRHILNMCQDRYRFMVGLAAAILADKISLLPSTYTEETLRQLHGDFADTLCLHDQDHWPHPYPNLAYPVDGESLPPADSIPLIPDDRQVAYVFTSGSTGKPVPHPKTWGKLMANTRAAASDLGLDSQPVHIVGTVPPQHMFGFESMVLLCLQGQCPLWSGKPFYPADIAAALAAMPEPRMLVTTPYHLQSLLDSELPVPPVALLLLATAPLPTELASRAEQALSAPLLEIYGSTETGQIATRQPTESPAWQLMPGIALHPASDDANDGLFVADGGHIERPVQLSDHLEIQPDGRFLLQGRIADQVNIAGKRSSISFLTAQLKDIPGVDDGVFFLPLSADAATDTSAHTGIQRLAALVVAPRHTPAEILGALRERLDPVFLPRPLVRVDALPYNDTGKLPRPKLQAELDRHLNSGHLEQNPA